MIIIMGFGMLFGIGSAILISIELGRGQQRKKQNLFSEMDYSL
jgi:Na+-driven multidrug efflux pump